LKLLGKALLVITLLTLNFCAISPLLIHFTLTEHGVYVTESFARHSQNINKYNLDDEIIRREKLILRNEDSLVIDNYTLFLSGTVELWGNSSLTLVNAKVFIVPQNLGTRKTLFSLPINQSTFAIFVRDNSTLRIINSTIYYLSNFSSGLIYLSDFSTFYVENSFIGNLLTLCRSNSRIFISRTELNSIIVSEAPYVNITGSKIGMFNLSATWNNLTVNLNTTYIEDMNLFWTNGTLSFQNSTVNQIGYVCNVNLFVNGNFTVVDHYRTSWINSTIKRSYTVLTLFNQTFLSNVSAYLVNKSSGAKIFNITINGGRGKFNLTFSDRNFTTSNLILKIVSQELEKTFDVTFYTKTPLSLEELDYVPPLLNLVCVKKFLNNFETSIYCTELYPKLYLTNSTNVYAEWNSNELNVDFFVFINGKLLAKGSLKNYTFTYLEAKPFLVRIVAQDSYGNSMMFNFILVVDLSAPAILDVFTLPNPPSSSSKVGIFLNVSDNYPFPLRTTLYYTKENTSWYNRSGELVLFINCTCFVYRFVLPKFPHNTTLTFYVKVLDGAGNLVKSKSYSRVVMDPYFEEYISLREIVIFLMQNAEFVSPKARKLYQMAVEYYYSAERVAKEGNFSLAVNYLKEAKKLLERAYRAEEAFHRELKFTMKYVLPILLVLHAFVLIFLVRKRVKIGNLMEEVNIKLC